MKWEWQVTVNTSIVIKALNKWNGILKFLSTKKIRFIECFAMHSFDYPFVAWFLNRTLKNKKRKNKL